jgi:hypothetical protein
MSACPRRPRTGPPIGAASSVGKPWSPSPLLTRRLKP